MAQRARTQQAQIQEEASSPSVPTSKSVDAAGRLKDTPANRALKPALLPQSVFEDPWLRKEALFADEKTLIFCGQVLPSLRLLAKAGVTVDSIVTSPPYYGQRDYQVDGQMGLEPHPREYLDGLLEVFDACWEILSETGSTAHV